MGPNIESVKDFWNSNPLFSGESEFEPGSIEFFEHHKDVYYTDCFAGKFDDSLFLPVVDKGAKVLDLGCGVGF